VHATPSDGMYTHTHTHTHTPKNTHKNTQNMLHPQMRCTHPHTHTTKNTQTMLHPRVDTRVCVRVCVCVCTFAPSFPLSLSLSRNCTWSSREFAKHSVYATPSGGMGVDAGMTGVAKERERSLWFAVAMHSGRGTTSTCLYA